MAWAASSAVSLVSSTDATSYATGSWVPVANRLYKADVGRSIASAPTAAPTLSGNGMTWVAIDESTYASANGLTTFLALSGSAPSTGALTADFAGVTQTGCAIQVTEIDGADISGTAAAAVVQSQDDAGSGRSASATLVNVPAAGSRCFYAQFITLNEAITHRTNWTELSDAGYATPARRLETQWRADASEQTGSASWTNSATPREIMVEIREASLPTKPLVGASVAAHRAASW